MSSPKEVVKYDLFKNALIGAGFGLVASLFVPFLRPVKGALLSAFIVAAIGVYKNLTHKSSAVTKDIGPADTGPDVAQEIAKFDALRKTGAITEEEFQQQKRKLLAK